MAGAGGTTSAPPPPPLRLKDLLELDCDSCSAAGFRCYPRRLGESAPAPMRHPLESSPSLSLRRNRPSSRLSHLSRSLSRRLSIWRHRDEDEDATAATAASTCSKELETSSSSESSDNSSGRTSRRSRSESDSVFSSATEASEDSVHHHPSQAAARAGDEHEVVPMKRVVSKEGSSGSGSETDDKEQEQLSPVAVMDFPFDDDDDDELRDAAVACSPPSFSLERLQRRKTHKIRRFGSRDELPALDLEARLDTTSDPDDSLAAAVPPQQQQQMMTIQCRTGDAATTPTCAGGSGHGVPDEDNLFSLLLVTVSADLDDASERLLLDFFVETKRRRAEVNAEAEFPFLGPPAPGGGVLRRKADGGKSVAAAAREWLDGTGAQRWGLTDVLSGGPAIVAEMDRGRRWMQVGEEEREVAAVVAGMLEDQLVSEVVRCLFL